MHEGDPTNGSGNDGGGEGKKGKPINLDVERAKRQARFIGEALRDNPNLTFSSGQNVFEAMYKDEIAFARERVAAGIEKTDELTLPRERAAMKKLVAETGSTHALRQIFKEYKENPDAVGAVRAYAASELFLEEIGV